MASRYSAARPKRAGEDFARTHHNDDDGDNKRPKFDIRNPSILAPDAREEDAILDADVIGGGNATKRGAVNLDGYDSDSDNETFKAKAESRQKGDVSLAHELDNYDASTSGPSAKAKKPAADDDDDDDMFKADDDEDDNGDGTGVDATNAGAENTDKKRVHFLDASAIQGEEQNSTSKSEIRLDNEESSDDEIDPNSTLADEGIDEEVGAGGRKKNAPKVEAFNLREEMQEGQFDQDGNYVRKAGDPDAAHDKWLDGLSKKEMKKAAAAHEKREAEARKQRIQEDGILVSELLQTLILHLEKAETPLEALARLGKGQAKVKKVPKWKQKKMNKGSEKMDIDADTIEDPEQARIKAAINAITDAADKLLSRDYEEIYEQEREMLIREYRRETGEDWVEPKSQVGDETGSRTSAKTWEFRWTDGRDGDAKQGPFDSQMMKAWHDAGYFEGSVEFRPADDEHGQWSSVADFA